MLTEKVSKIFIWIGLAIVIIGIILFFNGEELFQWDKEIKADKVAQLGDFVGGVAGALWALAGVILFYVALEKQKESLSFQIKEFKLQSQELRETRAIFKEQSDTQKLMQYETTFYNLIDLLQKIVNDINIQITTTKMVKPGYYIGSPLTDYQEHPAEYQHLINTIKGRECIKKIYEDIKKEIAANKSNEGYSLGNILYEKYEEYRVYLSPYFNILIQILVKIHNCPFDSKGNYVDIFGAMLTQDEINLIDIYGEEYYIDNRLDTLFGYYFKEASYKG